IAFQLVDDALDYAAEQERLGKTVGDDFREGKITMPVLAAFAAGDDAERAFWRRTLEAGEQDEADLRLALQVMGERGAIRATLDRACAFADSAKAALRRFPPSPIRDTFEGIADYTVRRAR
ncbi:MAG: polyprenyl synthetase family protein, partial [Acetobacteraceae bacterium]|nr:polyprenyl synthetase family protein [Acetobacteraceae bacterium]